MTRHLVRIVCFIAVTTIFLIPPAYPAEDDILFPTIKPLKSGTLPVSKKHRLYWEVSGSEDGIPVIVLHGGPGGSADPELRRFFDPEKFKIILFDQRGAGRSKPKGEWRENTTQLLVEDINKLRTHLGVYGKAILFGGSWGTTLAVTYAETHPDLVCGLVLRGVFLGSRAEIDHFYHGGTAPYFPANHERLKKIIPRPESLDYPRQLFVMTQSSDRKVRDKAINGWAFYEIRMCTLDMTDALCQGIVKNYDMTTFSVLENYYMLNDCFLEEGQLLRDAGKIAHIPTFIVNGRFDVICPPATARALAAKIETVHLEIVKAAHSRSETEIKKALVRGVNWLAGRIERD